MPRLQLKDGFLKKTLRGHSFCLHKTSICPYTLVASSYCGPCHMKLCASIFNWGTVWLANGRHKGTAAHFSDAKKNAHTSQIQALWFFLQHMCIFTITHYNEGLCNHFNRLYIVLSVLASRMSCSEQTKPVTVTQHQLQHCSRRPRGVDGNDGTMFPTTV